jgi:hypothetical protein
VYTSFRTVPARRPNAKLDATLAKLKAAGVVSAEFHPDGALAAVRFGFIEPTGEPEEQDGESPITSSARRALEVLRGQRKSMRDDETAA